MEALILSCGTGGGHNAAGYAVKEELERRGHIILQRTEQMPDYVKQCDVMVIKPGDSPPQKLLLPENALFS